MWTRDAIEIGCSHLIQYIFVLSSLTQLLMLIKKLMIFLLQDSIHSIIKLLCINLSWRKSTPFGVCWWKCRNNCWHLTSVFYRATQPRNDGAFNEATSGICFVTSLFIYRQLWCIVGKYRTRYQRIFIPKNYKAARETRVEETTSRNLDLILWTIDV